MLLCEMMHHDNSRMFRQAKVVTFPLAEVEMPPWFSMADGSMHKGSQEAGAVAKNTKARHRQEHSSPPWPRNRGLIGRSHRQAQLSCPAWQHLPAHDSKASGGAKAPPDAHGHAACPLNTIRNSAGHAADPSHPAVVRDDDRVHDAHYGPARSGSDLATWVGSCPGATGHSQPPGIGSRPLSPLR